MIFKISFINNFTNLKFYNFFIPRVEISRASYEPLGDVEAHLKHYKPPQPL